MREEARLLSLKALPNPIDPERPELITPTSWKVRVEFVARDVWIGVFVAGWNRGWGYSDPRRTPFYAGGSIQRDTQKTYVCLIPCFPIVITRTREIEKPYYSK